MVWLFSSSSASSVTKVTDWGVHRVLKFAKEISFFAKNPAKWTALVWMKQYILRMVGRGCKRELISSHRSWKQISENRFLSRCIRNFTRNCVVSLHSSWFRVTHFLYSGHVTQCAPKKHLTIGQMTCTSVISKCMIYSWKGLFYLPLKLSTGRLCSTSSQRDGKTTSCWSGKCGSCLFIWCAMSGILICSFQSPVSSTIDLIFCSSIFYGFVMELQDRFYIKRVSALPLKAVGKFFATCFVMLCFCFWRPSIKVCNGSNKLFSIRCPTDLNLCLSFEELKRLGSTG